MLTVENNETLQNALDALQNWLEQQVINLNIKIPKSYPLEDLLIKLIKYTIHDCSTHTISIETGIRLLYLDVCFDDKLKTVNQSKAMMCDDFRAIAIIPILSKVFEYCFLDRFSSYLETSHNQFGFKTGVGCNHAIYSVRNIVDGLVHAKSTVNVCALDLSKAFDKVNHHALFIKLMKINIPIHLLKILEKCLPIVSHV